jgi:hypothetical protein
MANSFNNGNTVGIYGFPSHDINPSDKLKKDWNVAYCKAIDSLYRNNLSGLNYTDAEIFRKWRRYGNGRQDKFQYMDLLGITQQKAPNIPTQATTSANPTRVTNDSVRKGFMNVNWDIVPVAPNFKNIILGIGEDMDYDIFADGIDEASSAEREQMKWLLWVEREMKDYFEKIEQTANVKFEKPDYIPASNQELELFSQLGGFKLKSEMAIEQGISYTLELSDWKEIRRKLLEDAFELGVVGVKDYVDPFTQKVKVRYCDPELCVIPYNHQEGFTNMPFAGEYTFYNIADIRSLTNPDGSAIFTEPELSDIARFALTQWGNPNVISNLQPDAFGRYEYDNFRIMVLDCEYKSDDTEYNTERTTADGKKVVHKDTYGKVRNSETKKTHVIKKQMYYRCKWIVGSEYAWDYGHQFDIPRPTPSQANSSYHFYKMKAGSYIERIVPYLDGIQLAWLKLQNALAKARPAGLSIEYGSLTNISMGNNKLTPLEVLRIANQTGDVLFQASATKSHLPSQTNYRPVQELQGGMGNQLNEYLTIIASHLESIRTAIGINRVADASSPSADQLVGVSEISMSATINSLKPMLTSILNVKERSCRNIALRMQMLVKFNKVYELGYTKVFGKNITQVLKIGSEIENSMFGIRIEARPNQQEKDQIMNAALESMRVGRQGQPLLGYGDYLMVQNFVNLGMTKYARAYIAQKEREAMDRMEQEKQAAIAQQGEQNAQLQQMKGEQEKALFDMEMQKITLQANEERATLVLKYEKEMELRFGLKEMEMEQKNDENIIKEIAEQEKMNNQVPK